MSEGSDLTAQQGWQVPAHDTHVFREKRAEHALVIPVINEGEKIRAQLRAFAAAGLPVDLVMADGGSSDGSLDGGILAECDARALLVKTGPGKLGAQLRMAYAWCLQEGYAGIVTMDGNGKDDVTHVRRFLAALEAGADYVQGSRYAPGGAAINTPRDRSFGNRMIHAPILSLAARRRLTDTTNGFRAYSRRYLLDPRVAPFRDLFQRYELLFYLTVRAGQLGYRIAEVPVSRRYPDQGKIPTKIAGWRGKADILAQTLKAALGRYAP
ncbi:glycosyltransferase family 2 protein [Pseudothioclava arenosa]|uniref:Glycosyl transferase family 2 n=1 Tax=Pseudothioclava arenosa TaxID=1795308 RepID=A0A2A4CNN8_9RHOB|nr:glycosyltransferase family 2 protein [Pseudothioclava arenosa]PCD75930.1 glycosyl transferase family 2 [Pseudothioclava arenosa]